MPSVRTLKRPRCIGVDRTRRERRGYAKTEPVKRLNFLVTILAAFLTCLAFGLRSRFMNKFLSVALLLFLSSFAFGQKPQRPSTKPPTPAKKTVSKPKPVPIPTPVDPAVEKAKLDEALALASAVEKISALRKFIDDFPKSDQRSRAVESLVTARAILGDEKLQANENNEGIELFKLAVSEAPTPIPERLFNEIVSKFPANLFYRDQRAAALEIAEAIEKKAVGNAKQLLNLATFYLGIESGSDAKRLAEAAIGIDPNSVAAYQTLGLANRLNFDLEESAKAYSKALELDSSSVASKRSLAEMKRALGKPDEAAALYREIIAANENDTTAKTGLLLSLFGAGKKAEAEGEMAKSLEQNLKNLGLLAGAAYWYAANDSGEKAVELAQKAVELEPRYIWGHIALACGLMSQKKPVEAERVLVMARQYGNFPTLDYEIASARLMTGFYREAVEELQKSFAMKDGLIQTKLGGRVPREEKSFADLIAYERRASIFEPLAADNPENAAKLKLLFEITQKLNANAPDETELVALTDEFVKGDDKMKLHRQIYSATLLLQKNIALPKVLELAKAAVGNTDAGLEVSTPAAAVMASELYESRTIAFARNEIIVVPDVPRQTLSAILRGRIEELTGWTLFQQKSYPEAVVRFRRAISVLPDKSAWWRSSMWRLGAALEADGKDKEALDSYIQSYRTDRPSALKYVVVEALYKKVHGSTEGLEAKIGPNPLPVVAAAEQPKPSETIAKAAEPASTQTEAAATPEKSIEKTSAPETPVNATEKNQTKVDETVTPDKQVEKKAQASEVPAKESPKVENAVAADKQADMKTQIPESPVKTDQSAEPKTENTAASNKQVDVKTQVPERAVTAPEVAVPKVEIDSTPDKQADAKTQPSNVSANASQPQANTEVPAKKDASADQPTNLLRDPLLTAEPDPKAVRSAEKPADTKTEPKTGNKPAVIVEDPVGNGRQTANTKDLFEPVIIKVPGSASKPEKEEAEKQAGSVIAAAKSETEKRTETKKPIDDTVSSGASRLRVVDGKEIRSDTQCSLELSQETVSLINGGGSLGILVSIVGVGDFNDIVTKSSSPKDVEIKVEPEIGGASGRRFYVIKSVSTSVGVYQVTFESPCGKKEIVVRVR